MAQAATPVVRDAQPADLTSLMAFNMQIAWVTEGRRLDPDRVRAGVERILRHPRGTPACKGFYVVVELDGGVRGSCLVTFEWSDWQARDYWWIQSVFVEKIYRGRGIFRLIYERVVELAGEAGAAPELRLYVEYENEKAKTVYSKLGMSQSHYLMFEENMTNRWSKAGITPPDDAPAGAPADAPPDAPPAAQKPSP